MELDYNKIKETISNLKTSMEYIEGITDEMEKKIHTTLPLQRELIELENIINKSKDEYSENIIAQLKNKKEAVKLKISLIYEFELLFNQALDEVYDFVQKHNFRPDKLKKHSDKEIVLMYNMYLIESKQNYNKCMKNLNEYVQNAPVSNLIELVNSQFQLTGHNRFYLKENIVMSLYCRNLKKTIQNVLNKNNFNLLRIIMHKYHSEDERQISPIEMLKAIVLYFNRKSVKPINP